jgi:hypothetical protein
MANHTITLTSGEESIYQKYLTLIGKDEAAVMAALKKNLSDQVIQRINEEGREKFSSLSITDKLTFLG